MNFGRVMAGSLGTTLMVTFMSMGSKWLGSTIATSGSKEMIQRQTVAAGVDVSFALVTLFVVVAFSFALFIIEPRNKNKNIREV